MNFSRLVCTISLGFVVNPFRNKTSRRLTQNWNSCWLLLNPKPRVQFFSWILDVFTDWIFLSRSRGLLSLFIWEQEWIDGCKEPHQQYLEDATCLDVSNLISSSLLFTQIICYLYFILKKRDFVLVLSASSLPQTQTQRHEKPLDLSIDSCSSKKRIRTHFLSRVHDAVFLLEWLTRLPASSILLLSLPSSP